jgi:predicted TIM-barrel fold metal-dependent hydrolase
MEQARDVKSFLGKICERFWDEKGNIRIRVSSEASKVSRHLEFMDEAGIDMAMLTINPELDLEQCKRWNDFCAETVKGHPNRFIGFACVPPLDGDPAFNELERAVKDLGLKGVHIFSRIGERTLDSKELWPYKKWMN